MSYNPLSTDSRSSSPVPQHGSRPRHHGPQDDITAPGSPYLNLLNRSLTPDSDSTRNPFQVPGEAVPSASSSSSSTSFSSPPPLTKSILKNKPTQGSSYQHLAHKNDTQHHHNYNQGPLPPNVPQRPTPQQLQQNPYLVNTHPLGGDHSYQTPNPPFAMGPSSLNSNDGHRDNHSDSVSSTHRSSRNLSPGNDPNYNLTQSDMTLEGLAERWQAYQAWWAKQYKEKPFYRIWTKSKWILLFSAILLLGYSCAVLAVALGYMFNHFENAVIVIEFHGNLVYVALAASIFGIASAMVGMVGIVRENRVWLSWYNVMLWPCFALYLAVGYISFRRAKNHLRAHLKDEWTHSYTRDQRLLVQRNLKCCGYQDPTWFGEYDLRCFPMINLPGCQHKYNVYEDKLLTNCWTASFSIVPVQLFVMIAALLCSNHVDGMLRSGRPGLKSFKEKQ